MFAHMCMQMVHLSGVQMPGLDMVVHPGFFPFGVSHLLVSTSVHFTFCKCPLRKSRFLHICHYLLCNLRERCALISTLESVAVTSAPGGSRHGRSHLEFTPLFK